MYPVAVRVPSAEPPRAGDLVFDAKAGEFRRDCGDIGYAESELHPCDWSAARRKELKNGTGLTDVTVDHVWSAWVVVVEQRDAYRAVERCGLVHVADKQAEFQQRVCGHGASVAGPSDNSWLSKNRDL